MSRSFKIHVDRAVDALARIGVHRKRSAVAEVMAATFGYRSSNEASTSPDGGRLDPPAAVLLGRLEPEGVVLLLDPVADLPFAVAASWLEPARGSRARDHLPSPYGNLLDVSAARPRPTASLPAPAPPASARDATPVPFGPDAMSPADARRWDRAVLAPFGLLVVAGADAPGRARTLDAVTRRLVARGRRGSVLGLLPHPDECLSLLRLDPNFFHLGELRDSADLVVAAMAVETGHVAVCATPSPSVAHALDRIAVGVGATSLPHVLRGVLAQASVPAACGACRGAVAPTPCPACSGTGESGHVVLSEVATFEGPDEVAAWLRPASDRPWATIVDQAIDAMVAGEAWSGSVLAAFGGDARAAMRLRGLDPREHAMPARR